MVVVVGLNEIKEGQSAQIYEHAITIRQTMWCTDCKLLRRNMTFKRGMYGD